jgi:molybdate transport system substrate-binding protein
MSLVKLMSAVIAAIALAACAPEAAEPVAERETAARVFAASSLTDVMTTIGAAYAAAGHPAPVFNFAASSELARQIEQKAEADIFISADEKWMDYLAQLDLIDPASRATLLGNTLVLVAPSDRAFVLPLEAGMDLKGALQGGRLAIANPDSVPAGRYAKEALESLGVWAAVKNETVLTENVRAALRFVEIGEAAAGIVYGTDARAAGDKVAVVGVFAADTHAQITFPVAQITARAQGTGFAAFLKGPEAKAVFEAAGFEVKV